MKAGKIEVFSAFKLNENALKNSVGTAGPIEYRIVTSPDPEPEKKSFVPFVLLLAALVATAFLPKMRNASKIELPANTSGFKAVEGFKNKAQYVFIKAADKVEVFETFIAKKAHEGADITKEFFNKHFKRDKK